MAKRKVTQELPQPSQTADETKLPVDITLKVEDAVAPEPAPPAEPKEVVVGFGGLKIETF